MIRPFQKIVADHYLSDEELEQNLHGKSAQYYQLLYANDTYEMSTWLKDKPYLALSPERKTAILTFICNDLLQNKAVTRLIETARETAGTLKKEKWVVDAKIKK